MLALESRHVLSSSTFLRCLHVCWNSASHCRGPALERPDSGPRENGIDKLKGCLGGLLAAMGSSGDGLGRSSAGHLWVFQGCGRQFVPIISTPSGMVPPGMQLQALGFGIRGSIGHRQASPFQTMIAHWSCLLLNMLDWAGLTPVNGCQLPLRLPLCL